MKHHLYIAQRLWTHFQHLVHSAYLLFMVKNLTCQLNKWLSCWQGSQLAKWATQQNNLLRLLHSGLFTGQFTVPDTQPTVSEHCMVSTTGYFKHASVCYVPLGHVQAGCRIECYEEREAPGSYSQHHQSTPFHSRPTLSPAKHHINCTSLWIIYRPIYNSRYSCKTSHQLHFMTIS